MKYVGWARFAGQEIVNEARVRAYGTAGLIARLVSPAASNCCSLIDEGYVSPEADPAPWYDAANSASGEFFGILGDIRVDSVVQRGVTQRATVAGAAISRPRARSRIVAFSCYGFASTDRGMAYGEAWLRTVLAGSDGCEVDSLELLQACDVDSYRTLRRVGIVDGPTFGPIGTVAECRMQAMNFQLVAGLPYLLHDASECLAETILVGGS